MCDEKDFGEQEGSEKEDRRELRNEWAKLLFSTSNGANGT